MEDSNGQVEELSATSQLDHSNVVSNRERTIILRKQFWKPNHSLYLNGGDLVSNYSGMNELSLKSICEYE